MLEVALREGTFSAHGYPDQMIKLSKVKDGTNVFIMHKGPSIEKEDAVAFESLKFRDHYIHIDSNNNVKLKKLEDPEAASKLSPKYVFILKVCLQTYKRLLVTTFTAYRITKLFSSLRSSLSVINKLSQFGIYLPRCQLICI